jgi:hypothetical protein
LKIIGIDARDDDSGYLIFSGLARLAYRRQQVTNYTDPVWVLGGPGTTTWPPVTQAHQDLALAHLTEHGARMPDDAAA